MEGTRRLQVNKNIYRGVSSKRVRSNVRRKSKAKAQKIKVFFLLANFFAIIVLMILMIGSYSEMVRLSSNNVVSKAKIEDLNIELASIEDMAANTSSLKRVEKVAQSRLNMDFPSYDNLVALDNEFFNRSIDGSTITALLDQDEQNNQNHLDNIDSGDQ